MNQITIYLIGLGITTLISFLIAIYINPYLKKILLELNDYKERPLNFWVAYTSLIFMLVPLIYAIWIVPQDNEVSIFLSYEKSIKVVINGAGVIPYNH